MDQVERCDLCMTLVFVLRSCEFVQASKLYCIFRLTVIAPLILGPVSQMV